MARQVNARRLGRTLLAVALAFAIAASVLAPAVRDARAADIAAVNWSVDKAAHTITVEVHIAFLANDTREASIATVNDRIAFIEAAIRRFWDGAKFKCYTLKVKLFTRLADSHAQVGANEVAVKLDTAIYAIGDTLTFRVGDVAVRRSFVTRRAGTDNYLSESPADAMVPDTGSDGRVSEWQMLETPLTYAHEFGHILGLDDNYTEAVWTPKPGAKNDLMGTGTIVDPTTMTRLIRRAGINDKDLPCPLTWDLRGGVLFTPFDVVTVSIHAWTCDYDPPSNLPGAVALMKFEGDVTGHGDHSDPIFGSVSGGGTEQFSTTYVVGDPNLRATFSTGLVLSQPVLYLPNGLFSTSTASLIGSAGPADIHSRSEFTNGAKECP